MPRSEPIHLTESTPEWMGRLLECRATQRLIKQIEREIEGDAGLYLAWKVQDVFSEFRQRLEERFHQILAACPETLESPELEEAANEMTDAPVTETTSEWEAQILAARERCKNLRVGSKVKYTHPDHPGSVFLGTVWRVDPRWDGFYIRPIAAKESDPEHWARVEDITPLRADWSSYPDADSAG